jgi:hypothetical protein
MLARPARILALATALAHAAPGARGEAGPTGDRLVVAINNVPYSQRHVETYVAVKESLRKNGDGAVRLVDASNWSDAVAVFTEDMIILQEAHRLGSFATLDQTVEKFQGAVREKAAKAGAFRAALTRLGVSDQTLVRTLEDVLRVAAFRRGREKPHDAASPDVKGAPAWLVELTDRAVVRLFSGAETFVAIAPPEDPRAATPPVATPPGAPESGKAGDAP